MEVLSHSTAETKELAVRIAQTLKAGDVLALYGDLGAGKTTFVQGLVEALGFDARVQSPTFIVVRHYLNKSENGVLKRINHIDLYRIQNKEELSNLGISEMLEEEESLTVIEWPELLEGSLPKTARVIKFESIDENTRKITL